MARPAHCFRTNGWGYLVTERISLLEVSDDQLCQKAAEAVTWLHAQRIGIFGSLGETHAFHTVFQRGVAPKRFTSVAAAQAYLNAVRVSLFRSLSLFLSLYS